MPFDAAQTTVLPLDSPERWSVNPNAVAKPRNIPVYDDNFALYSVLMGLRYGWAKRYNDGDRHCIVGWVGNTCEPMTVTKRYSEQSRRLLKRLHDALPKSAQRKWSSPEYTLAKYNDTHGHAAIVRVAERAYETYFNERCMEAANARHPR